MTDTTTDPAARALQQLAEAITAGIDATGMPAILCLGCTGERVQAARSGAPEEQWPRVSFASLIVGGNGQCLRHVQFTDRPVMPGQTASGLFLAAPGQGM